MENPLTRHEAELIQHSFYRIEPGSIGIAHLFYQTLFERHPDMVALFPVDMTRQKKKIADTLNIVVNGCMFIHKLKHSLEELGRVHKPFYATQKDYDAVIDALIFSLENQCIEHWSEETALAWRKVLQYISNIMMSV